METVPICSVQVVQNAMSDGILTAPCICAEHSLPVKVARAMDRILLTVDGSGIMFSCLKLATAAPVLSIVGCEHRGVDAVAWCLLCSSKCNLSVSLFSLHHMRSSSDARLTKSVGRSAMSLCSRRAKSCSGWQLFENLQASNPSPRPWLRAKRQTKV